jgi:hypothetical protein
MPNKVAKRMPCTEPHEHVASLQAPLQIAVGNPHFEIRSYLRDRVPAA